MKTVEDFIFSRNSDENFASDLFEWDDFFLGEETTEVSSDIDESADWQDETERRFEIPDEEEEPPLLPSLTFPEGKPYERSEEIIQDWEGVVDEVDEAGKVFTARLRDLTVNEIHPSRTAEIPVEDVSDDDRKLLHPGAVFYLTAGRSLRNGRLELFGRIVFRRLPGWTSADWLRIEERAQRLIDFLGPEN